MSSPSADPLDVDGRGKSTLNPDAAVWTPSFSMPIPIAAPAPPVVYPGGSPPFEMSFDMGFEDEPPAARKRPPAGRRKSRRGSGSHGGGKSKSGRDSSGDRNKVLIGNLAPDTDTELLVNVLADKCGPVLSSEFGFNLSGNNFGFVRFARSSAVDAALALNSTEVMGQRITVSRCAKTVGGGARSSTGGGSPNNVLVLKNLPFGLDRIAFEDEMNEVDAKPLSVSYHCDTSGNFSGIVFADYSCTEDATVAFKALNGRDIQGRKVRVEYKLRKDRRSKADFEPRDEESKRIYDKVRAFKDAADASPDAPKELAFEGLNTQGRRSVHAIAERLGLGHVTTKLPEGKIITVSIRSSPISISRRSPSTSPSSSWSSSWGRSWGSGRRSRSPSRSPPSRSPPISGSPPVIFTGRPSSYKERMSTSWGSGRERAGSLGRSIAHQARGPDGSRGFAAGRGKPLDA